MIVLPARPYTAERRFSWILVLLAALLFGLVAGWVDVHNDEVQAAVLVIVCGAGALGLTAPRLALVSGALVGLGVPIVHAVVRLQHYALPLAMDGYWESFIALLPGLIAASIGALVRRAATSR